MATMLALCFAAVVFYRICSVAEKINRDHFFSAWQYHAIVTSYAAMFAGALGIALSQFAPVPVLVTMAGVTGLLLVGRRAI